MFSGYSVHERVQIKKYNLSLFMSRMKRPLGLFPVIVILRRDLNERAINWRTGFDGFNVQNGADRRAK